MSPVPVSVGSASGSVASGSSASDAASGVPASGSSASDGLVSSRPRSEPRAIGQGAAAAVGVFVAARRRGLEVAQAPRVNISREASARKDGRARETAWMFPVRANWGLKECLSHVLVISVGDSRFTCRRAAPSASAVSAVLSVYVVPTSVTGALYAPAPPRPRLPRGPPARRSGYVRLAARRRVDAEGAAVEVERAPLTKIAPPRPAPPPPPALALQQPVPPRRRRSRPRRRGPCCRHPLCRRRRRRRRSRPRARCRRVRAAAAAAAEATGAACATRPAAPPSAPPPPPVPLNEPPFAEPRAQRRRWPCFVSARLAAQAHVDTRGVDRSTETGTAAAAAAAGLVSWPPALPVARLFTNAQSVVWRPERADRAQPAPTCLSSRPRPPRNRSGAGCRPGSGRRRTSKMRSRPPPSIPSRRSLAQRHADVEVTRRRVVPFAPASVSV